MQLLEAKPRAELGKKTNVLRRAGFLPAVVYGEGTKPQSISVSARDFEKIYKEAGESSVITLTVGGSKPLNAMIHEVAYDALTGKPIHADFYSVRMDKEIETKVPLEFIGESLAVKGESGILVKVMHDIEVRALPANLPHEIKVDIDRLIKVGDRIYIKDLFIPAGVTLKADPDDVVALVAAPRSEEELAALATEVKPEVVEVKTEQEIKAEEKATKVTEETSTEAKK